MDGFTASLRKPALPPAMPDVLRFLSNIFKPLKVASVNGDNVYA